MKSELLNEPHLSVVRLGELSLSGTALSELLQAVFAKGKSLRFLARGRSMSPFIQDGDVITVVPLQEPQPGIGEVIAFIRPYDDKLVVHRIVAQHAGGVIVQGDLVTANSDGVVPLKNLLGKVVQVERKGRSVWLGLGPERLIIAWLSRMRFLIPMRLRLALIRKRDL